MGHLSILSAQQVRALTDGLGSPERIHEYRNGGTCTFLDQGSLLLTPVEADWAHPPSLKVDETSRTTRPNDDAANAELIHHFLPNLTATQASDHRLWTTLTHTTFWDYTRRRWPLPGEGGQDHVVDHWFLRGSGLGAMPGNAVARLWWAAHLTVAPWERDNALTEFHSSDRFRFTKGLLSRQQIVQDVLDRSLGSNLRLRTCLLYALETHRESVSNVGDLSIAVAKQINLQLKYLQMDAIPVEQMREAVLHIAASEVAKLQ